MKVDLRKTVALLLTGCLLVPPAWADLDRNVQVFVYQPWVFADRKLTVGLPGDRSALRSMLWYLRMDESTRSLAGMDQLGRFIRRERIPGLDFTGHRTLTNNDLEFLFRADLWKTSADPNYKFRLLKLAGTLTDDRALPTIGRLLDLKVLSLSDKVSDNGMRFLKSLVQLHSLVVPSAKIGDQSLETLAQLSNLQRLSIKASQVTDAGLSKLKALPLRQLDLGPQITDVGVQTLRMMTTLEDLNLQAARVSSKGLASLSALPRLHTLFLGASWRDADMPALKDFSQLKRLDLSGAAITDQSAPVLSGLKQLEELALSDTSVGPATLDAIRSLPNLRYLEISRTKITPAMLRNFKGADALQVISFSSTARLKADDLRPLAKRPQLHTIIINGVPIRRALVERLRAESTSGLLRFFVDTAYAGGKADKEVEDVLEVAAKAEETPPEPQKGLRGLAMIHETEASLDEIIAAPTMIGQDNQQNDEKNFLGEITVGVQKKSR